MNLATIYPPRYYVAANENAQQHNLTLGKAGSGSQNSLQATKIAKGSMFPILAMQRHLYFPNGAGPTLTIGGGMGSGGSPAITSLVGVMNDGWLPLQLVTGAFGRSAGTVVTITFAKAMPGVKIGCFIAPITSNAWDMQLTGAGGSAGATCVISCAGVVAGNATYQFAVLPVGMF